MVEGARDLSADRYPMSFWSYAMYESNSLAKEIARPQGNG